MTERRSIGRPALAVTLVLGTAIAATSLAAQTGSRTADGTTERVQPVAVIQKGAPPTGPFPVVVEHDQSLATHTIYRPATLTLTKHPLLVWGEGACAKDGLMFPEFLSEIASHGFVVLADGPPVGRASGGPGVPAGAPRAGGATAAPAPTLGAGAGRQNAGASRQGGAPPVAIAPDGTALIAAIDWMAKETADGSSRFFQKVDVEHVAAMGMSCGGLMSYGASADPRVATVGIWNSGLLQPDAKIFAGLHAPVIIVTGGESDIAYANGKRDYETMPPAIPVFYGVHPSVGHGGTYSEDNGGPFGVAAVAWLKWQLTNDSGPRGKGYFVGAACGLCADAKWQVGFRSLH
jgi:hypothetical protein